MILHILIGFCIGVPVGLGAAAMAVAAGKGERAHDEHLLAEASRRERARDERLREEWG